MYVDLRPRCGSFRCRKLARFADTSGIGYCAEHAEEERATAALTRLNPWWTLSMIASQIGGETAAAWKDLEYGQFPTVPRGGSRD